MPTQGKEALVHELLKQGKTTKQIMEIADLSKRQVQRHQASLRRPSRIIRSRKDLILTLQEKASEGDFLAIRTLLRERSWDEDEKAHVTSGRLLFSLLFPALTDNEIKLLCLIIKRATTRTPATLRRLNRAGKKTSALDSRFDNKKLKGVLELILKEGLLPADEIKRLQKFERELLSQ